MWIWVVARRKEKKKRILTESQQVVMAASTNSFDEARHGPLQSPFGPRIAVFASQDVDDACKRNHLSNFVQLLRPFEYIDRVNVRHANYSTTVLDCLRLSFFDADQLKTDLEAKSQDDKEWLDKLLDRSVFTERNISTWDDCISSRTTSAANSSVVTNLKIKREHEWLGSTEEESQDYPQPSTPWYIAFLNLLLEYRPLVEYDHTSHPIAALIVVSTNHPEPLNEFSKLYEKSGKDGSGWPKKNWLETGTILRYYILVHEINDEPDGGRAGANELLDSIKRAYGLNCSLVCINSENTEWLRKKRLLDQDPNFVNPDLKKLYHKEDYWSKYQLEEGSDSVEVKKIKFGELISEEDVLGLKVLLRELALQSLVPHIERCIQQWNDSLSASRKGITSRLLSVGKKYFSKVPGSGSSSPSLEHSYNPITYSYPYQSQEAQTRRLADFSFMIGDYKFASQMYDYLRKDAFNDKAWTYYSSATQMIGLCTLLQSSFNQRTKLNIDLERFLFDRISTTPSVSQLKMVMVYYEMAKAVGNAHLMSSPLIRIAVIFNEPISALIYEQVSRIVSPRQAALYIVLASHRYELARQNWLSKICLRQCPQFNGWTALEDYLDDKIANLAEIQSDWAVATIRYWNVIRRRIHLGSGMVHQEEEEIYVQKFRQAFKKALENDLPLSIPGIDTLPIFDVERCKIRIPHQDHVEEIPGTDSEIWSQLISRSPGALKLSNTYGGHLNTAIVNEPFYLVLVVKNPLRSPIKLTHIDIKVITLGPNDYSHDDLLNNLQINPVDDVELLPLETREVSVKFKCNKSCIKFEIAQVSFKFDSLIDCSQRLKKRGNRLQNTLTQRLGRVYSEDKSMIVHVRDTIPILELIGPSTHLPSEVYHGVSILLNTELSIRNTGQVGMKNIHCVISDGNFFRFCPSNLEQKVDEASNLYETIDLSTNNQTMIEIPNNILQEGPTLLAENLDVGATVRAPMVCRGEEVGQHVTYWFFVFQHAITGEFLCYRHVQHLKVLPSLKIQLINQPSLGPDEFYVLSLELDCSEVPEEIEICQVSTISTHWRCKSINLNSTGTSSSNALVQIPKRSSSNVDLFFEIFPLEDTPQDESSTQIMLEQLGKILKKQTIDSSQISSYSVRSHVSTIQSDGTPAIRIDSPTLLGTILPSQRNSRRKNLQKYFTTLTPQQISSTFPLTSNRSMDLIIFWKTNNSTNNRFGYHLLSDLIKCGATRDILSKTLEIVKDKAGGMFHETQSEYKLFINQLQESEFGKSTDPVLINVRTTTAETFFDWDFELNGPLTVPVTFTLKNSSPCWRVDFQLELLLALQDDSKGEENVTSSSGVDQQNNDKKKNLSSSWSNTNWIGKLKFGASLDRLETRQIQTQCWILEPGLFHLGNWKLISKYASSCALVSTNHENPLWLPDSSTAWIQFGQPSSFISISNVSSLHNP